MVCIVWYSYVSISKLWSEKEHSNRFFEKSLLGKKRFSGASSNKKRVFQCVTFDVLTIIRISTNPNNKTMMRRRRRRMIWHGVNNNFIKKKTFIWNFWFEHLFSLPSCSFYSAQRLNSFFDTTTTTSYWQQISWRTCIYLLLKVEVCIVIMLWS